MMMTALYPEYEMKDPNLLYCNFCSGPMVRKADLQGIPHRAIELGKCPMDYNAQSNDLVLDHQIDVQGCGKEALILFNYLQTKKQKGASKKRARVEAVEEADDENEDVKDENHDSSEGSENYKKKGKKTTVKKPRGVGGRIGSVVTNFMRSRGITNYVRAVVREEMYNTFIIDFGRLYHRSMISLDTRRLVSTRNISDKEEVSHVKRGVVFPDGFKTVTVTKGYIHEIQIHHDDAKHIPLYKIFVYDKDQPNFPLIASNTKGYVSAQKAYEALSDLVAMPGSPKIVTGIEYSGVQQVIIDHFKNDCDENDLLIDKLWLDAL